MAGVRPDDLAATVIRTVIERAGLDPAEIDDVYFGAANQSGEDNRNVARMAALLAGLPTGVPGVTVNRLCASGLEAVNIAARMIEAGSGDVFVAGGVESMSRAPYVLSKAESSYGRMQEIFDTTIGWRFVNPRMAEMGHTDSLGITAENVAKRYGVTRADQDRFALLSQQRWGDAQAKGRFKDELVSVQIPQRRGDPIIFEADEHPRPDTTLEKLSKLRPAFADHGTVTAGNSAGVNDGAAALLLVEEDRAKSLGMTPLAFIGASATAGVEPAYMGIGPVPAIQKVLSRTGKSIGHIGLVELNEAFAAQAVACARELELNEATLNVNGGAISIGHPLGASGARLAATLIYEMNRRDVEYGLVSLCVGVGQGIATVIERA